jgi:hypothetical protein
MTSVETKSMSVPSIEKVIASCNTSEGRYQVAEVSEGKYILVIGGEPLQRRDWVPIEPAEGVRIHHCEDRASAQEAWKDCEDSFEASGDLESAKNLREAWMAATGSERGGHSV